MAKHYTAEELTNGTGKFERWVRLPTKPGERLHGLSRAHLYQLIDAGEIKTASCKKPGRLTGVRLVWEQSVVDYIERHLEGPQLAKQRGAQS